MEEGIAPKGLSHAFLKWDILDATLVPLAFGSLWRARGNICVLFRAQFSNSAEDLFEPEPGALSTLTITEEIMASWHV